MHLKISSGKWRPFCLSLNVLTSLRLVDSFTVSLHSPVPIVAEGCTGDCQWPLKITMTSQWAWWRLRSRASWLFTQPFIQAQIRESIKALRHFVRGIYRGPVNSPHKWPVTRKMFLFDDVIMKRWKFSLVSRKPMTSSWLATLFCDSWV